MKFFCNFNLENKHELFTFQKKNSSIFQFKNGLFLHARILICRCKYSKCKPNMTQYFNLVNFIRKSEHLIAKHIHDLDVYYRK